MRLSVPVCYPAAPRQSVGMQTYPIVKTYFQTPLPRSSSRHSEPQENSYGGHNSGKLSPYGTASPNVHFFRTSGLVALLPDS